MQFFEDLPHSVFMKHIRKYRAQYPHLSFQTKALPEIDGKTYLMTMESWYWKSLDIYLKATSACLKDITEFCIKMANRQLLRRPDLTFDEALHDALTYYIYGGYLRIYKTHQNIANDFWPKEN